MSHTSASFGHTLSTAFDRVRSQMGSLATMLGFMLVVSGIVGLFFIQAPLQQTTEDRSQAANDEAPVSTTFAPTPGTQLVYNQALKQPVSVDFLMNTANRQVETIQYVFNMVAPTLEAAPEITLEPSTQLQSARAEIQQVADGYLISINLVPKTPGSTFVTTTPTKLFSLAFQPTAEGAMSLSFDDENTFAAVRVGGGGGTLGAAVSNGMQPIGSVSYSLKLVKPVEVGKNPINWNTGYVSLMADDFFITTNGQTFVPNASVRVGSDQQNGLTDGYTTLEAVWMQNDLEMRMFMYAYKVNNGWEIRELRVYNGKNPGDWIFASDPVIATGPGAGKKLAAATGQAFSASGVNTLSVSRNGSATVTLTNFTLKAFLPVDDLFINSNSPVSTFSTTDASPQGVAANALKPGTQYRTTIGAGVQNVFKDATSTGPIKVQLVINGKTDTAITNTIPYEQIAKNSEGMITYFNNVTFTAVESNTFTVTVDPSNEYAETNESNNSRSATYTYQSTGGTSKLSCNDTCSLNEQCPINHRCYDTGSGKRCRLVTFPSSESCNAPASGSLSCNSTCSFTSQCSGQNICWEGSCRNPSNVTSSSCANPSTAQQQAVIKSCNQTCSSNKDCGINLRCYSGACRLATNPSSSTCVAATTTTVSSAYSQTKGGTSDAGASTATSSAQPSPMPTATVSAQPVVQTPPAQWQELAEPQDLETAPQPSLLEQIKTFAGETGKLAMVVIAAGVGLLLLSLLWGVLSRFKKKGPPPTPPTPERPVTPINPVKSTTPANFGAPLTQGSSIAPTLQPSTAPGATHFSGAVVPKIVVPNPAEITTPPTSVPPQGTTAPAAQPYSPAIPAVSAATPTTVGQAQPVAQPAGSSMLARIKEKGVSAPGA